MPTEHGAASIEGAWYGFREKFYPYKFNRVEEKFGALLESAKV